MSYYFVTLIQITKEETQKFGIKQRDKYQEEHEDVAFNKSTIA
jgi:hypothetical protein